MSAAALLINDEMDSDAMVPKRSNDGGIQGVIRVWLIYDRKEKPRYRLRKRN